MGCDVLLLLFFVNVLVSSTAGNSGGVCISPGGRFPPFSSEGKPPRKVTKGPKDLTLCRLFRKRTCCDVTQTHPALLSIRRLASAGEASQDCLHLWELLECSICDPRVGVQPGPPLICESLCDMGFQACSNAYFSVDVKNRVLSPCGSSDIVCGRAAEWVSNGTELCHLAGFSVHVSGDTYGNTEEPFCYGGKASLDSIADSWKVSQPGVPQKAENMELFEDFHQWVREMPFIERVSWAIGGMVLTAGLVFISKRKSHSHRQKQAAVLRAARKLEARVNQQSFTGQGRKIGSR
ncbi:folate receptor family protein [Tasmannia lanceolata]|uniref:folate receptor family protein n=1 Tax=Tasmannia lanceolata TaxID=3420 RepID=UPI004064BA52